MNLLGVITKEGAIWVTLNEMEGLRYSLEKSTIQGVEIRVTDIDEYEKLFSKEKSWIASDDYDAVAFVEACALRHDIVESGYIPKGKTKKDKVFVYVCRNKYLMEVDGIENKCEKQLFLKLYQKIKEGVFVD